MSFYIGWFHYLIWTGFIRWKWSKVVCAFEWVKNHLQIHSCQQQISRVASRLDSSQTSLFLKCVMFPVSLHVKIDTALWVDVFRYYCYLSSNFAIKYSLKKKLPGDLVPENLQGLGYKLVFGRGQAWFNLWSSVEAVWLCIWGGRQLWWVFCCWQIELVWWTSSLGDWSRKSNTLYVTLMSPSYSQCFLCHSLNFVNILACHID